MNGKRPCKSNRPKERAALFDDFDHCVIKRTIHGLYSRKIAPTVSIIHKEIKLKCYLIIVCFDDIFCRHIQCIQYLTLIIILEDGQYSTFSLDLQI
jgi:hypothetical protein